MPGRTGRTARSERAATAIRTPTRRRTSRTPGDRLHGERLARHDDVYGPAFTAASEPLAIVAGDSDRSQRGRTRHSRRRPPSLPPCSPAGSRGGVPSRSRSSAGTRFWRSMPQAAGTTTPGSAPDPGCPGALGLAARPGRRRARVSRSRSSGCRRSSSPCARSSRGPPAGRTALRARRRGGGNRGRRHGALRRAWPLAIFPLIGNAALETSYAFPHRLEQLGLPDDLALAVAIAALVVGLASSPAAPPPAARVSALAACLVLVTTPYLAVWYLAWAVPVAAAEEDTVTTVAVSRSARTCCPRRSRSEAGLTIPAAALWRTITPSSALTTCQRLVLPEPGVGGGELLRLRRRGSSAASGRPRPSGPRGARGS